MAIRNFEYMGLLGEPESSYEEVINTTPATQQAAQTRAEKTTTQAESTQVKLIPDEVKSQLDAFGPYDPNSEVWYFGGPQIVYDGKIYRKDPSGNIDITIAGGGPGSLQQVVSPTGELLLSTTDTGETSRLMGFMQTALPAVAASALLGPAGTGLFSAPAAAAIGSGGTTLARGGSVEDALKAAALAGLGAYGTQEVTGLLNNAAYDLSFAAADAAQLANQGLNASAIAQNLVTYVDPATAVSLANTAVTQSFALADANQLTQQGLSQNQVAQVLENSGLNANTAANIAQAAADGVTTLSASDIIPEVQFQRQTNVNQGLLSPADAERVMVTGQAFDIPGVQQLTQGVGAGVSAATATTTPQAGAQPQDGQQVQQTQIEASRVDPDTASTLLSGALGQPVSVAGSTQQVQVSGEPPVQMSQTDASTLITALSGQQVQVTGQTATTQQAAETLPAGSAGLLQTVPVTSQNLPAAQLQTTAPAATAGLLTTPTQTAPTQQVETTGQREVQVEDRLIPTITTAPIIQAQPGESVSVEGKREPVETATAVIPSTSAGVTAPAQPTTITARDAALVGLLLAGAGSIGGGEPGEPVSGPISEVIPGYSGRGSYQMPSLFQIAPTNVYNPFATVAPFGAGRFGAVNQPITLPYGLLAGPIGLMAGINPPTRGLV